MEVFANAGTDDRDCERMAQIHAARSSRAGEIYPLIDALESARAAARHHRLTDWLDDWNR